MTPIFNKGKVMDFGKIQESHHFIFGVDYTFFYLEDLHSWLNFKLLGLLEEKLKQNQSKQDLFEILIDSYPVLLKIGSAEEQLHIHSKACLSAAFTPAPNKHFFSCGGFFKTQLPF